MHIVEHIPDIAHTVDNAKVTLASEIGKMKQRSINGGLDIKEARVFNQLVDALIKLSKEEREINKEIDLANMSEEDLMAEVEKMMNVMNKKGDR